MIVRAHECVMDGFERFAQGHLITLFSATNYCGTANNAGAILVRHICGIEHFPVHMTAPTFCNQPAARHIRSTILAVANQHFGR